MKLLDYVNTILFWIFYYVTFTLTIEFAIQEFDAFDKVTTAGFPRRVRYFSNIILFSIALFSGICQSSKLEKAYREIDEVDKYLKYFNVLINHEYCMRQDVVFILGIIMVTLFFNLMDYHSLKDYSKNYIYTTMWILDRIPDFLYSITICCISILLDKISFRFERVNEIIQRMIEEKQISTIEILSPTSNSKIFIYIRIL